jgi:hypothetical protein
VLYLYCPFGPLWPIAARTVPLPYCVTPAADNVLTRKAACGPVSSKRGPFLYFVYVTSLNVYLLQWERTAGDTCIVQLGIILCFISSHVNKLKDAFFARDTVGLTRATVRSSWKFTDGMALRLALLI